MKLVLHYFLAGFACLGIYTPIHGAIVYTGGTLMEDFDTLPSSSTSDYYGVNMFGLQTTVPGTSGWEGTQLSGSTTNGMDLIAFTLAGTSSGSVGSAGQGTLAGGNNERAISSLASGSWTPAMGVEIVNQTGQDITFFTIKFTQELWRTPGDDSAGTTPGVVNTVAASWGTTASGALSASYLSSGTGMTAVSALDLVSPAPASSTADPIDLDGNLPENQTLRSTTINFSTPIANGESFFLRFQDFDDDGRDATMAIDNFMLSSNVIPEPASILLLGLLSIGSLAWIRRKHAKA